MRSRTPRWAEGFDAAAEAAGVIDRRYRLAGRPVVARYAGGHVEALLHPALAHLEDGAAERPVLTLHVYDSHTTGVPTLDPPPGASPGTLDSFFAEDGDLRVLWRNDSCQVYDAATRTGWLWLAGPASVDLSTAAAPFRTIIEWWARADGLIRAHAGAVGHPSGGVLIGGNGGSGKSTTSLACLHGGLGYAGDDVVLVSTTGSPHAWSLYNTAKLEADHGRRLPWLTPAIANPERLSVEKALAYVAELAPERCVPGFPLRAILLPRVTGELRSRLVPMAPSRALIALAPSSIVLQAADQPLILRALSGLVQRLPCWVLEAGTDLDDLAATVSDLLDELDTAAPALEPTVS